MLRRKLLWNLGPLVTLLLISAVAAIALLQRSLARFDEITVPADETQQSQVASTEAPDVARARHSDAIASLRHVVIGITFVFVIVINLSVIILLRMASMVVRPVDKLVEATRALTDRRYDFRVRLEQRDEFDELAGACNALAERLQADEQRRMEIVGQVALAMNHEINNAIAIIELQLRLLSRQPPDGPGYQRCLTQIHQSLGRMTEKVQALKTARRIVLTDYLPGMKMLDLEKSQESGESVRPADEHVEAPAHAGL